MKKQKTTAYRIFLKKKRFPKQKTSKTKTFFFIFIKLPTRFSQNGKKTKKGTSEKRVGCNDTDGLMS